MLVVPIFIIGVFSISFSITITTVVIPVPIVVIQGIVDISIVSVGVQTRGIDISQLTRAIILLVYKYRFVVRTSIAGGSAGGNVIYQFVDRCSQTGNENGKPQQLPRSLEVDLANELTKEYHSKEKACCKAANVAGPVNERRRTEEAYRHQRAESSAQMLERRSVSSVEGIEGR